MNNDATEKRRIGDIVWSIPAVLLFALFAVVTYATVTSASLYPLDFAVFHGAGQLFADGQYATAYDFGGLTSHLETSAGLSFGENGVAHFLNPPPFGWFAQVLASVSIGTSYTLWTTASVGIIVGCYFWLGLPVRALPLALLSPMVVSSLALGQTGAFTLLAAVATHKLLLRDKRLLAGSAAGLFLLKPPVAVGYGLLWLLHWRKYAVAIGAALVSGLAISAPMWRDGLGPWRSFVATSLERSELDANIDAGSSFTFAEFVKPLLGDAPLEITLFVWALGFLLGSVLLVVADRRTGGDVEILSGAAAVVTVLFSPHVLAYDALLLLIPVAVAHRHGALDGIRVGALSTLIGLGIASRLLIGGPNVAFPLLVVAVGLVFCWTDQTRGEPEDRSAVAIWPNPASIDGEGEDLVVGQQPFIDELENLVGE